MFNELLLVMVTQSIELAAKRSTNFRLYTKIIESVEKKSKCKRSGKNIKLYKHVMFEIFIVNIPFII